MVTRKRQVFQNAGHDSGAVVIQAARRGARAPRVAAGAAEWRSRTARPAPPSCAPSGPSGRTRARARPSFDPGHAGRAGAPSARSALEPSVTRTSTSARRSGPPAPRA